MHTILLLLKVSRPRFWLYLAGPYLIGYILTVNSLSLFPDLKFILHLFFFIIPANLFLYGVNDLSDEDTDKHNPKKNTHEHLLQSDEKKVIKVGVGIVLILTFFLVFLQPNMISQLCVLFFLFLGFWYSTKPLRFKTRPVLDFSSNFLYALPGVLSYSQVTNRIPETTFLIGFFCWTSAMHLFSAIPDIQADKKVKILTTAVLLGRNVSLWLCAALWLLFFVILIISTKSALVILFVVYPCIPILVLLQKIRLEKAYWWFPFITGFLGLLSFWYIVFTRFYA